MPGFLRSQKPIHSLPFMLPSETLLILQAASLGALHALIPCAHSWPMLVPFLARGQRATTVAWCFGAGMLVACTAVGLLLGGLASGLSGGWLHKAEEGTGVVLVLIGAVLLWRTRAAHFGHMHGNCETGADSGCEHRTHQSGRFARLGPSAALFALGLFNAVVPCWTSLGAVALAAPAEDEHGALLALLAFGLSATLCMWAVLFIAARGFRVLERLRSPKTEAWVMGCSGLVMVLSGASLLLHWHEHS